MNYDAISINELETIEAALWRLSSAATNERDRIWRTTTRDSRLFKDALDYSMDVQGDYWNCSQVLIARIITVKRFWLDFYTALAQYARDSIYANMRVWGYVAEFARYQSSPDDYDLDHMRAVTAYNLNAIGERLFKAELAKKRTNTARMTVILRWYRRDNIPSEYYWF